MGRLDDFMDNLKNEADDDSLNEPGIGSANHAIGSSLHRDYQACEIINRVTLGDPANSELPINMGKVKGKDMFLLGIGDDDAPFKLNKNEFLYLLTSLTKIGGKSFEDEGLVLADEVAKALDSGDIRSHIGSSDPQNGTKERTIEELQELLEKRKEAGKSIQEEEPDTPEYEDAVKSAKDMQEIFESLSPEEKKILEKDIAEQRQNAVFNRAKALEKDLTGDLETEPKIEYNYAYFNKIYKDKGTDFMREELAKIPKEERKAIIDQIVQEVKAESKEAEND